MKCVITNIFIFISCLNVYGQGIIPDSIFIKKDGLTTPEPILGMRELFSRWSKNVEYPKEARDKDIQGKVIIYVIVDATGAIIDSGIVSGIGHGCDEAALNGFRKVDLKWRPGGFNGKVKSRSRVELTFMFKL